MAGEIIAPGGTTGATAYFLLWNLANGQIYDTTNPGFEAYSAGSYANYDNALTEAGGSATFIGDMPGSLSRGNYGFEARIRAGGSPAETDVPFSSGTIKWTGSDEEGVADVDSDGAAEANVTKWLGNAVTSGAIPSAAAGSSGGIMISGSNTGPWSVSGGVSFLNSNGDGLTVASNGGNGIGLVCSGNGTGHGILSQSGTGATGNGIQATARSTNGSGLSLTGTGTGSGLLANTLTVSGATTLTGAVSLGSTLTVTGTTTFAAVAATTITTSGTVTLNALTVTNATTLTGAVSLGSTLTVTGTVTFGSTFTVTGTVTFNSLVVSTTTTLTGAVSLGSTLAVTGATSFAAITGTSITLSGALQVATIIATGSMAVGGSGLSVAVLTVTGATTLGGTITATDASNDIRGIQVADIASGAQGDIRTAVGLASANLDTQLGAIDDYIDTEVAAIKAKTDQLTFTIANQVDATVNGAGTALNTYQAKISLFDDNNASTDRYAVVFYKNGQPVTSGITVPTIQVIKVADGTDLVASTSLTEIGSTGLFRYDEATAANRVLSGSAYVAKVTATIDSATRTWFSPVGRDSS